MFKGLAHDIAFRGKRKDQYICTYLFHPIFLSSLVRFSDKRSVSSGSVEIFPSMVASKISEIKDASVAEVPLIA